MSQMIDTETLDFVDAAGKALAEAEKIAATMERTDVKLAEVAPKLAKQMVSLGLIDANVEETAVTRLKDPVKVAEILGNVLGHYAKKASATKQAGAEDAPLGAAVAPAAQQTTDGGMYTGRRLPPSAKTAADEPLRKLAGLS